LNEKAIRRGSFVRVPRAKPADEGFMQAWNESTKAVHMERTTG